MTAKYGRERILAQSEVIFKEIKRLLLHISNSSTQNRIKELPKPILKEFQSLYNLGLAGSLLYSFPTQQHILIHVMGFKIPYLAVIVAHNTLLIRTDLIEWGLADANMVFSHCSFMRASWYSRKRELC